MGDTLTAEKVCIRVESIRSSDTEQSQKQFLEAMLWCDVLVAISNGCYEGDVSAIAREALRTTEIDFARIEKYKKELGIGVWRSKDE